MDKLTKAQEIQREQKLSFYMESIEEELDRRKLDNKASIIISIKKLMKIIEQAYIDGRDSL